MLLARKNFKCFNCFHAFDTLVINVENIKGKYPAITATAKCPYCNSRGYADHEPEPKAKPMDENAIRVLKNKAVDDFIDHNYMLRNKLVKDLVIAAIHGGKSPKKAAEIARDTIAALFTMDLF